MERLYPDLIFPARTDRPFFYANFVSTIDGKVAVRVNSPAYWPIGSTLDYTMLVELRAHADALVHGKTTACAHPTLQSLSKPEFKEMRRKLGKPEELPYAVVTNHPDERMAPSLVREGRIKTILATHENAKVPETLAHSTEVVRCGKEKVDIRKFAALLHARGIPHVLVEGGPTLFASFLEARLIDEIFLTIAPKIFGDRDDEALTMAEGFLFPPDEVSKWKLLSVRQEGDELFLRYRNAEFQE